jgi:hypothetical protein
MSNHSDPTETPSADKIEIVKGHPTLTHKQVQKEWKQTEAELAERMHLTSRTVTEQAYLDGALLNKIHDDMLWPHVKNADGTLRFRKFADVIESLTIYKRSAGLALRGAAAKLTKEQFLALGTAKAQVIGASAIKAKDEALPRLLTEARDPKVTERDLRSKVRVAQGQDPLPPRQTGRAGQSRATGFNPLSGQRWAVTLAWSNEGVAAGHVEVSPGVFLTLETRKPAAGHGPTVQVWFDVPGVKADEPGKVELEREADEDRRNDQQGE